MNANFLTLAMFLLLLGSAPHASAAEQKTPSVATAPGVRADAKPVEELQLAAQRMRDAIHAMAKAPAGAKRSQAIKDTNRALMEVNNAMSKLPPEMLTAAATEGDYKLAIDRLQQSADRLRDAAQALAKDPYSKRRNETIKDINKALLETQQVLIDVPLSAWGRYN